MLDLDASELNKNVRRNKKYKILEDKLVHDSKSPSFTYLKDLMIFSAFLGLKHGVTECLDSDSSSNGITLQTYSGTGRDRRLGQHGLIFLIALHEKKDMDILRRENVDEAIEIFEKYCNGGLSILMSWLIASGNEPSILLNKLLESEASLKSDLVDLDMDDF
ncbi:hypothetical protein BWP24_12300 [Vibrio campbellii]|uniref:hypothetical protein n=1 Tax=Vibrio campbellii TaxID=680 RepID=UPI000971BCDC|nr:hypothetical protein [Vibrio campbellii]APX06907.1 hypothetical protein BWP24_12300 [Vibrio campbellii]